MSREAAIDPDSQELEPISLAELPASLKNNAPAVTLGDRRGRWERWCEASRAWCRAKDPQRYQTAALAMFKTKFWAIALNCTPFPANLH
jgi:hypothetical protein